MCYPPFFPRASSENTLESLEADERYRDAAYRNRPCKVWSLIQDLNSLEVFIIIGYNHDRGSVNLMDWPYEVNEYEIRCRYDDFANSAAKERSLESIQDYAVLLHR